MAYSAPQLGHGVGLRTRHFQQFLEGRPRVDWVEAISENFMSPGGRPLAVLEKVRRDVPLALHGVALSIGGSDPLDEGYLSRLAGLVERFQPAIVSDHLCWGSHGGRYVHDLLPLPYTEEALRHIVTRVEQVQERLGRQILLENVSSYLTFKDSAMTEWEFLAEIARRADCGILFDVNNIYVSGRNHGFDPRDYIAGIPVDRVGQIHLAGHRDEGAYLFDTHDRRVCDEVWQLYAESLERFGRVSTLIEWDEDIPPLETLLNESNKARAVAKKTHSRRATAEHRPRPRASEARR
jgi:uncharacterized protein (UPF0276 family)